jgi:hypothetical protein
MNAPRCGLPLRSQTITRCVLFHGAISIIAIFIDELIRWRRGERQRAIAEHAVLKNPTEAIWVGPTR